MHELSNIVYMPEGTIIERAKRNTKEPRAKEGGEREQKRKGDEGSAWVGRHVSGVFFASSPPLSFS